MFHYLCICCVLYQYLNIIIFKRFSFSIFSSEYSRTFVPQCWVEKSCNIVVCLFVCLLFAFILHFFNYLWHSPTVKLASHSTAHHFPPFSTHFLIHIFRSTFLLKLDSSDQTSSKHCVIMKYFDSLKLSLFFQTIGTKISAKS
jgi:hypothetical protein